MTWALFVVWTSSGVAHQIRTRRLTGRLLVGLRAPAACWWARTMVESTENVPVDAVGRVRFGLDLLEQAFPGSVG